MKVQFHDQHKGKKLHTEHGTVAVDSDGSAEVSAEQHAVLLKIKAIKKAPKAEKPAEKKEEAEEKDPLDELDAVAGKDKKKKKLFG